MSAAGSGEDARCARAEEASEVETGTDVSRETSAVCSAVGADTVATAHAAEADVIAHAAWPAPWSPPLPLTTVPPLIPFL